MNTDRMAERNTLSKPERLNKKLVIDRLFAGGNKSLLAYPLRVVYMPVEAGGERASVLVSVPKKRFRRAVKRNRVKRQVREAYRKNKYTLLHVLEEKEICVVMGFIWLDDKLHASDEVEEKVKNLLIRIGEKMKTGVAVAAEGETPG